ncbi:MAG: hypothetical protein JJE22_17270, partial [Bacteroidia bacterium]|nr:hypothetical protein [Bacteroidia bacterium]
MAILANCSKFLFYSKTLGASFEKTLMLGRLELYVTQNEIRNQISFFGNNEKKIDEIKFPDKYAEPLFQILGASVVDSIDYSDYEHATIIHDLNNPFPDNLKNKYTVVMDGGTIEHVFNFPMAIRNCMEALQPGGHYIGITPANNLMGHGFYQFSPELYFRVFSPEFGFMVKKICLVTQDSNGQFSDWYEVTDPVKVRNRIMITNSKQTYLMVLAQKTQTVDLKNFIPLQSDYETRWA